MQEIGIGVVGWGFMGRTHTHALRELGLFYEKAPFRPVLKCVCTRREEAARQAMRDGGFERCTTNYSELLAMEDIQVVSICTPNGLHRDMAVQALQAGKHVYVDKPLAMDEAEALEIRQAVHDSGLSLQVVHNNRFLPSTMRARELIQADRIGQILSFRFDYLHSGSIDPAKTLGWKMSREGGVLLDLMSHAADLALWLCGPADRVLCDTRLLYDERPLKDGTLSDDVGEDQVVALMRLKCGALGTLEASKIATGTDDELLFSIYGAKGALRWNLMEADYLHFYDNTLPEEPLGGEKGFRKISCGARFEKPGGVFLPVKNTIGWDRSHMHCYYSFLNAVACGGPVSPDIEEALALQRLMDAMRRSRAEGRWISLPD